VKLRVVPWNETGSENPPFAVNAPFATVSVNGTGFASNEVVNLSLATAQASAQADASGNFTAATITVPAVTSGLYTVQAVGATSGARSTDYLNYFWIDGFYPSAAPSSYYLLPTQTLSFTGSGFAPNETINVTETAQTTVLSSFTADATGAFTAKGGFSLPVSFQGTTRSFTLTGAQSNVSAQTSMTIGQLYAYASPSAYWLLPEASLSFTGGGFASGETVSVYRGSETTALTSFATNSAGEFMNMGSVNVPGDAANGSVTYRLVGNESTAQTSVAVSVGSFYPSIAPSTYYVQPGTKITVTGSGFAANEVVTLSTNTGSTATATTDALGNLSGSLSITYSNIGSATINALGAKSKAPVSVGVTLATMYASITPSTYYAYPADTITFTGTGFVPGETVTVDNMKTKFVTADTTGAIVVEMQIPNIAVESTTFTFTGSVSNTTVESKIALGTRYAYLSSDKYYAFPFETVNVTGNGFAAGETVMITAGEFTKNVVADTQGVTPAVEIPVPASDSSSLKITFTGGNVGTQATLDIGVGALSLSIDPDTYYAKPGSMITFTGSGFTSGETIAVTLNNQPFATTTTNSFGAVKYYANLPVNAGRNSSVATFTFKGNRTKTTIVREITLAPFYSSLTLSTYYAQGGSSLTISGTGFAPNEKVVFQTSPKASNYYQEFDQTTADASGSFSYATKVPYRSAEEWKIRAVGLDSGAEATTPITIAPVYSSVQLGSYAGAPGTAVTFIGSGYLPNEVIHIATDRSAEESLYSFSADANGNFSNSGFVIPSSYTEGNLKLVIHGGYSMNETVITYYVTGN
jgi:large repetitive protein